MTYIRESGKRVEEKYTELPPVWYANKTQVIYDAEVSAGSQSEIEFVVLPLNRLIDGDASLVSRKLHTLQISPWMLK